MAAKSTYSVKDEFTYPRDTSSDPRIACYISDRLLRQIDWYDQRSRKYQDLYKRLVIVSTSISAGIPVLTLMLDFPISGIIRIIIMTIKLTHGM
jgi:hypothetical protein